MQSYEQSQPRLRIVSSSPAIVESPFHKIVSWNVNGYRDVIHNWLTHYIVFNAPDVIFLSETKKSEEFLRIKFTEFVDYNFIINSHVPWKWHGVAMLIRKTNRYQHMAMAMNIPVRNDNQSNEAATGRVIAILLNNQMYLVGSYTPNSGRNDIQKLTYRVQTWDPAFAVLLDIFRNAGPTIWLGDINVALDDIDVSNPKSMKNYAGFTVQERHNLRQLLTTGNWVDIWRHQHPYDKMYTWRGLADPNTYGMRLDNIIMTSNLVTTTEQSYMITNCPIAADHVPVCVNILRN